MLVGSIPSLIVNFSYLEVVSASAKQLKDIVVCVLDREPDLASKLNTVSLDFVSPLSRIPSLP